MVKVKSFDDTILNRMEGTEKVIVVLDYTTGCVDVLIKDEDIEDMELWLDDKGYNTSQIHYMETYKNLISNYVAR